jgi:hypothetical protein
MKLSGDRCKCTTCGEYFNSTYAFDRHRTGQHGVDRRCRSRDEMGALGMDKNAKGFWISSRNADLAMRRGQISGDQGGAATPV